MFHNRINQIPVFDLKRNLRDNLQPPCTRNAHGSRLFDSSTVCLSLFFLLCFLILLLLINLGQVFILNGLEQMTVTFSLQDSTQSGVRDKERDNRQNLKSRYFRNNRLQNSSAWAVHSICLPFAKFT